MHGHTCFSWSESSIRRSGCGLHSGVIINRSDCRRQGGNPRIPGLHPENGKVNDEVNTLCQKRWSNGYAMLVKKWSLVEAARVNISFGRLIFTAITSNNVIQAKSESVTFIIYTEYE
ncbi:hypothetical protein [Lonsdalea iberica]|uniref:hypothetical protein n=1 Tax=Lonsdalea iberica TaxID=1082703 RepID=UPI00111C2B8A|nr:hypothetical protein [Lonsdalea iberica]